MVPRRVVRIAIRQQADVASRDDDFAVGVGQIRSGIGAREGIRRGEGGVLEAGVAEVDAAIDDGDLDAQAGAIGADLVPGVGDLVQQHGAVEHHVHHAHGRDSFYTGQ